MRLYLIFALAIALLAISFALQNVNLVTINLFIWQLRESLSLVLLATLAIGVVVGLLFSIPAILRRGWSNARLKHQTESLTTQIQSQQQATQTQSARADEVRHSYEALLSALALMDETTGLLHQKTLPQAVASLLSHMHHDTRDDGLHRSVCLFLLQVERVDQQTIAPVDAQVQLTWQAVSSILKKNASVQSWLYSDGQGQFACTATGLDLKEAGRYGEALQGFLTDNPLQFTDGSTVEVNVSVGGAFCDRDHPVKADQLISQAQDALTQSQNRGRNRFRLLEAAT